MTLSESRQIKVALVLIWTEKAFIAWDFSEPYTTWLQASDAFVHWTLNIW